MAGTPTDKPPSIKDAARLLVDHLPDDATWADVLYEISVRQSVEAGLAALSEGRVTTHAEARRRLETR